MNHRDYEPDKHQHKMEEEEYNYWEDVYNKAYDIIKEHDANGNGRIYKMPYDKKHIFDVMRESWGKKGKGCYRPASSRFNEMFVSVGGRMYELINPTPISSPSQPAF